jgi:manganese efflux pump family protein
MDLYILILIAVGLSVDSFAVSVSCGLILTEITFKKALRIAFSLSVFQAVMPIIGWTIGREIAFLIKDFDHWVAFGLLFIIGVKMIIESFKTDEPDKKMNPLEFKVLMWLSLATSIDALIVGIGFSVTEINLWITALIIGFTTGFFSMLGILFGKTTGLTFGKRMEILGGIILIFIGVKILFEHLMNQ